MSSPDPQAASETVKFAETEPEPDPARVRAKTSVATKPQQEPTAARTRARARTSAPTPAPTLVCAVCLLAQCPGCDAPVEYDDDLGLPSAETQEQQQPGPSAASLSSLNRPTSCFAIPRGVAIPGDC